MSERYVVVEAVAHTDDDVDRTPQGDPEWVTVPIGAGPFDEFASAQIAANPTSYTVVLIPATAELTR